MLRENRIAQGAIAALPLLLTPLLIFATAEGWLNFGGGEKDLLLAIPYLIGTVTFFVCAVVLIIRRWPIRLWVTRSAVVSASLLLALAVVAYVSSWLGVAGH